MALSEDHDAGRISQFLFGALVGAGIALLLAPQSGEKLRRALRDYAARVSDEGDDALESATQAWDSAKERGEQFVEKGKESVREAARHVKGEVASAKNAMHEIKEASHPR
jgi:gas vesicle protein